MAANTTLEVKKYCSKDLLESLEKSLDHKTSGSQMIASFNSCVEFVVMVFQAQKTGGVEFADEEERKLFGRQLAEAAWIFDDTILTYLIYYMNDISLSALKFRSGLQFLLDDYGDFPSSDDGKPVREVLEEEFKKSGSLKDLDEMFYNLSMCPLFGNEVGFIQNPDKFKLALEGVHDTHVWWQHFND